MFEKSVLYCFNILVDGTLWPIEAVFTGEGELRDGVEYGTFYRIQDSKRTTKFVWSLEQADANQPVSWGEVKETWG